MLEFKKDNSSPLERERERSCSLDVHLREGVKG